MSDLVQLTTFESTVEAELARTFLESYGVQSVIFDAQMAPYVIVPIGVRLMVLDRDLKEAGELLNEYKSQSR